MDILIIGCGVIGATYGYLFNKSGYNTEHFIRQSSSKANIESLTINLLDGRTNSDGVEKADTYTVKRCSKTNYDYIFISVPSGGIADVVKSLDDNKISGTILLCSGIWEDIDYINNIMCERKYILGYPVAGGNIKDGILTCCVFDHFMLEKSNGNNNDCINQLEKIFSDCQIKIEQPYNMLEWIWIHMAINAGVVSVAGKYGDINNTSASAEQLMDSSALLHKAIIAIRETTKIVGKRGVNLKKYNNELFAYKLPCFISIPIMKRMFAKNVLTRKIMTLHGNVNDLIFVCRSLYNEGKNSKTSAPVFYDCFESITEMLQGK